MLHGACLEGHFRMRSERGVRGCAPEVRRQDILVAGVHLLPLQKNPNSRAKIRGRGDLARQRRVQIWIRDGRIVFV